MGISISQERARLAAVDLVLRRREQWGSTYDYSSARSVIEPATLGFCHISVTNGTGGDAAARTIERIGASRFPNTGFSYNACLPLDSVLREGQPLGRRGAHTVNDDQAAICSTLGCPSRGRSMTGPDWNLNYNARALVFARMPGDPVSDKDVEQAARWFAGLQLAGLMVKSCPIHGHRCCSSKDCPSAQVWARMDDIVDLTATYVRNGLPGTEPPPLPPPPKPEEDDMAFVTKYGSTGWRFIIPESTTVVGITQAGAEELKRLGFPSGALPNVDVNAIQAAFNAPELIDIVGDEEAPPVP